MTKDSKKSKDSEAPPVSESRADGGSKDGLSEEEAKKLLKADFSAMPIGLKVIMFGGPFVYLVSAVMVVYYPQVMTWLGLEPFIEYLIQAQIEGYKNVVKMSSFRFADYVFYFHAASLLIMGVINAVFIVFLAASLRKLSDVFPDAFSEDYKRAFYESQAWFKKEPHERGFFESGKLTRIVIENPRILYFMYILVVLVGAFSLITFPEDMGYKRTRLTISANNNGIGIIIVLWISYCIVSQFLVLIIASQISHYYWPSRRKWFVDDESHKHD